jgi:hypothetical protein
VKVTYTDITDHASSRQGARIHGLVLHTTEGDDHTADHQDLVGLGQLFHSEEASAHLAVNRDGVFARYVNDRDAAWAVCYLNPVTLNLEQVGFAEFSRDDWFGRHAQLHGAAEFLAYGHIHYGVPLHPGKVEGGAITEAGVFQHGQLGLPGSGHSDCGPGYPQGYVTLLARYFIANRLHPDAPYTVRLRRELDNIRRHHGVPAIG